MVDYTLPILFIGSIMINYLILYKKNRLVGNMMFLLIGAGAIYIHTEAILFGIIIMFVSFASLLYDTLAKRRLTPG